MATFGYEKALERMPTPWVSEEVSDPSRREEITAYIVRHRCTAMMLDRETGSAYRFDHDIQDWVECGKIEIEVPPVTEPKAEHQQFLNTVLSEPYFPADAGDEDPDPIADINRIRDHQLGKGGA